MITVTRYHDFSAGHRVFGHESKCSMLHGHNYRVHFTCKAGENFVALDEIGRVIDFSMIKSLLCAWLEDNWDHKTLLWERDPWTKLLPNAVGPESIVVVPFNPTAENMAHHLLHTIAPKMLNGTGVRVIKVVVEETRKCSAEAGI